MTALDGWANFYFIVGPSAGALLVKEHYEFDPRRFLAARAGGSAA
jgi:hypothetical protein